MNSNFGKIRKSALLQYIFLYFMLLANGSRIWIITMRRKTSVAFLLEICVILLLVIFNIRKPQKYNFQYGYILLAIMLINIAIVRMLNGGVGIQIWVEWALYIAVTYLAISIDKKNFLNRFINIMFVFGIISLIGYFFQMVSPNVLKSILPRYDSNFSIYIGYGYNTTYTAQSAWGKFLFSFDERQITKNVGIFSEPGVYQILLNTELFFLVFMQRSLKFSTKQYNRRLIIALIALLTTQSTTGYFGAIIIFLLFYIDHRSDYKANRIRRKIIEIGLFIIIVLVVDLNIRGDNSLVYSAIISKIFSDTNSINLGASSGVYRLGTIYASSSIMLKSPLGVGYDRANAIIGSMFEGSSGAALFVTGAALGVFGFCVLIIWTLYPVLRYKNLSKMAKLSFVLIYFNTAFAQSEEIYTGLIAVALVCYEMNKESLSKY